jgi:uncharacterized protein YecT (DUF1311 family)
LSGGLGHAASFDCSKAKTPLEKAVCGSPKLSAADNRMAAAYRAALATVPPEMKSAVRDDQVAWISAMGIACKAGVSASSTEQISLLGTFYESRTKELGRLVRHIGGVTFVWRSTTEIELEDPDTKDPDAKMESRAAGLRPGYGTLHASWPQSTGDTAEWRDWNSAIKTAAQNGLIGDANTNEDITVEIVFAGKQLVASEIVTFRMERGTPHPDDDSIEFNWLLQEKREIQPADIFREGSDWDRAIQASCVSALHKQLGNLPDDYADGRFAQKLHEVIVRPRNWRLAGQGLTIIFQPYSVSDYADPADPVTIQWAALKPFLREPGLVQ